MDISSVLQNFKNQWLGQRIADPTLASTTLPSTQWYQCVSLIKQYLREEFGVQPGYWGDAIDYWNHTNPALLEKFDKIPHPDHVNVGDICVLAPNHIVIATGNYGDGSFEALEQNGQYGSGTGQGADAIRTRYIPYNRMSTTGALRLKGEVLNASPAPAPVAHDAAHVGQVLVLPANVSSWRVYRVEGPWTSVNPDASVARLNPAQYGGLRYDILGNPAANIYVIQTQMFGQVALYAGPDTPASFEDKPAAEPAPAPAPAPAPTPSNITYTKLDQPLHLVVNKNPTNRWDLGFDDDKHTTAVDDLPQGSVFVAYGKAQRNDGDRPAYFMTQEDFGQADTTGVAVRNVGVNTVDLSPAADPVEPPKPAEDGAEHVPVNVVPADPNKWQQTFTKNLGPVTYAARTNAVIHDLSGVHPDVELVRGQKVVVGGWVEKDGVRYARTVKSISTNSWYGIEEDLIGKPSKVRNELKLPPKEKIFKELNAAESFLTRLLHRKHK